MYVKRFLMLMGLCVLFAGCSTEMYSSHVLPSDGKYASTNTGVRYLLGRGIKSDDQKAFYYFNKGAEEGDVFAQNEVAYLYAAGKGTPRNYKKALHWYQTAANRGLASAQFNLGLMYLHGLGASPNKEIAMSWFQKAATNGFLPARQLLASRS